MCLRLFRCVLVDSLCGCMYGDNLCVHVCLGVCTVRLMDENHFGDPVYIYYALSSFKKGIPCRSTMFNVFGQNFARRPDEIEIRLCNMSCKADCELQPSYLVIFCVIYIPSTALGHMSSFE